MLPMHAIVFFLAIQLSGDADHVEMVWPRETLLLDRGEGDRWTITEKPKFPKGELQVKDASVTWRSKTQEKQFDIAALIGANDKTDWSSVERFAWGEHEIQIARPAEKQAVITIKFADAAGSSMEVKVGW